MKQIKYRSGYKYQLVETYQELTDIFPEKDIATKYISLTTSGLLIIWEGYAWDGPSGPTFDTDTFMRGSAKHDAFYQLMRMGLLNKKWKKEIDFMLKEDCLKDGMCRFRAWYVYKSIQYCADFACNPKNVKTVKVAPKKRRKK